MESGRGIALAVENRQKLKHPLMTDHKKAAYLSVDLGLHTPFFLAGVRPLQPDAKAEIAYSRSRMSAPF